MSCTVRTVLGRLLLIGLFLGTYATVWRPVRIWLGAHVVGPLLRQVDTPRARTYEVHADRPRLVEIRSVEGSLPAASFTVPTGALFVLGSVFLLAVRPSRPYWLYLGLYQWSLGAFMLALMALGLGWTDGAFSVCRFIRAPVYLGTSLALPLVFVWRGGTSPDSSPPDRCSRRASHPSG